MNDQNKAELRRLAEKATPGEWNRRRVFGQLNVQDENFMLGDDDASYIAAANPAAVLSLLDENEQLRAHLAESQANDRTAMGYLAEVRSIVGGEDFPGMVREVEALRKDAERYRVLRDHGRQPIVVRNHVSHLYHGSLDYAIDAAMAKETAPK